MALKVGSRARHVATGKEGTIGAVEQMSDGPRFRLDHTDADGEHQTWGEETRFTPLEDAFQAPSAADAGNSTSGPPSGN